MTSHAEGLVITPLRLSPLSKQNMTLMEMPGDGGREGEKWTAEAELVDFEHKEDALGIR